jgi:hypothetical protein
MEWMKNTVKKQSKFKKSRPRCASADGRQSRSAQPRGLSGVEGSDDDDQRQSEKGNHEFAEHHLLLYSPARTAHLIWMQPR